MNEFSNVDVPRVRGFGNYNADFVSEVTGLVCPEDESMTQQSFKDECDINTIVKRFGLTGELPSTPKVPLTGDFTGVSDFQTAMESVVAAQNAFMEFPAEIRAEFANDPGRMIEFISNPANKDKAIDMGLVPKPPEVTRDVVQAVDELAARLAPVAPPGVDRV